MTEKGLTQEDRLNGIRLLANERFPELYVALERLLEVLPELYVALERLLEVRRAIDTAAVVTGTTQRTPGWAELQRNRDEAERELLKLWVRMR